MGDSELNQQVNGPKSIAVITCSSRPSRIGHLVAQHVTSELTRTLSDSGNINVYLSSLDLESYPLPLLDEPGIPAMYPASDPTQHYTHEHTRVWSAEILKHSAFIFVTPQYNWGYPASIKNAIDYLFHEWSGKPAMVVSYGGHGGRRAAAQLIEVCSGLRMKPVQGTVGYTIKLPEGASAGENGEFSDDKREAWKTEGADEELQTRFKELLELLQ